MFQPDCKWRKKSVRANNRKNDDWRGEKVDKAKSQYISEAV